MKWMRQVGRTAVLMLVALLAPMGLRAQSVVLKAARMLDVASGQIQSPALIVITGDRITSIGGPIPRGARVIDLGDVTLLPGLIDMHTHLTDDISGEWVDRAVNETAADAALRGAHNAKLTLDAGFTTVRDVGSRGFADVSLMHAIDNGLVPGPRMFPSGYAIGITGGHCDETGRAPGILELGPEQGVADGVDQILHAVRYQAKHGAKVIKICATAGVLSLDATVGAQQLSFEEMRAVVEEATRQGLKVAAHAHGAAGINAAVRAGVASIEHGSMLDDSTIALMVAHGTYLVPTAYLQQTIDMASLPPAIAAKAREVFPLARASHRRAIQAGVKIAFGTDAAVMPHGQNAHEFGVYVDYGMSPLNAIRTATTNAADLLGVTDRALLAPGRLADIIAVPGNPLNDIHLMERVDFVMKGGVVVRGD